MGAKFITRIFIQTASISLILLFVYASVSKLVTFELFQTQLGQSPLLSAFAGIVSYTVLAAELVAALFLAFPKTRRVGFFLSFGLMTMFTAYIAIILTYSSFVPCSCGGILENLGWKEHLYFNIFFTILPLAAILIERRSRRVIIMSLSASFASVVFVAGLYILSERKLHRENPFVRRFDKDAFLKVSDTSLRHYTHYFAGFKAGHVYLGNAKAPLEILDFEVATGKTRLRRIHLNVDDFPFRSVHIRIADPYFFVADGTVPVLYKGKIKDWNAIKIMEGDYYFSKIIAIGKDGLIFRAQDRKTNEHVLGKFYCAEPLRVTLTDKILQKQFDGIFDTDGTLTFDPVTRKVVYTYLYRNQFLVANEELQLNYRGKTIDTVNKAAIKTRYIKEAGQTRPSIPAQPTNKLTSAYGGKLYVNATLRGKYEPISIWKGSSYIDVYRLEDRSYLTSFYIRDNNGSKIHDMIATPDGFFVLQDNRLLHYKMNQKLK